MRDLESLHDIAAYYASSYKDGLLSPVESNAATSGRIKCSHPEVGYSYQLVLVIQELVSASEV